ncbi:MAG: hypothetical protein ACYDIC_08995 [Desulfobaccales bacterium]
MARILCLVLAATLLFSLVSPFSLSTTSANPAFAQATAPAPAPPAKPKISFSGGPGDTAATAVVISGAPNSRVGIDAEYYYLMKKFGKPNADWKLKRQSLLHLNNKHYDQMEIELKDGSKKAVFFDITEFFGKL